ncbi:MAG: Ribosome hibernation promotion factor [Calditrichaeota bacterium]|nr:Ribosome hibernation promotion factor [Calditrichota bacterium]
MQVIIQGDGINLRDGLKAHIEKEVSKLHRFYDRLMEADVVLEGKLHQKAAKIRLQLPRETLVASDTTESFETSVDSAVNKLTEQLKRHKEKLRNH